MAAPAVPASTVILLRNGPVSPEVLMLCRHARSEFLPDNYVFPGGRVEERDFELADHVAGITAPQAAERLQTVKPDEALGFYVAAVRETWEESGILLARRRGEGELLGAEAVQTLDRYRLDVQSGSSSFADLIEGEDLELACDRLAVHAHWITPEDSPKRYDTIFFATRTPLGQRALHDGHESTDHVWARPEDALTSAREGKLQMILPTTLNLETLCGFGDADEALAASRLRPVVPVLPHMIDEAGELRLVIREDAGYATTYEVLKRPSKP